MLNFITNHITEIASITSILAILLLEVGSGQKEKVKKTIVELVLEAEKSIVGTSVGNQRLEWVIAQVKIKFPILIAVPNATIIKYVNEAVTFANTWLENKLIPEPVIANTEIPSNVVVDSATVTSI